MARKAGRQAGTQAQEATQVGRQEWALVLKRLVHAWETGQKNRIALDAHVSATGLLHPAIRWARDAFAEIEEQVAKQAKMILRGNPTYEWLTSIRGVGELLAFQVMAYFPTKRFSSPGKMWAYAGLVPGRTSYSRRHKVVAFKLAMSQVMTRGDYRPYYEQRKAYEWERNLRGELADQARQVASKYSDSQAKLWVSGKVRPEWVRELLASGKPFPQTLPKEAIGDGVPMLIPAHIEARARRWMAKLMLDHYFQVDYYHRTGEKWVPWVIAHGGHVDKIDPVNAPWLLPIPRFSK